MKESAVKSGKEKLNRRLRREGGKEEDSQVNSQKDGATNKLHSYLLLNEMDTHRHQCRLLPK